MAKRIINFPFVVQALQNINHLGLSSEKKAVLVAKELFAEHGGPRLSPFGSEIQDTMRDLGVDIATKADLIAVIELAAEKGKEKRQ